MGTKTILCGWGRTSQRKRLNRPVLAHRDSSARLLSSVPAVRLHREEVSVPSEDVRRRRYSLASVNVSVGGFPPKSNVAFANASDDEETLAEDVVGLPSGAEDKQTILLGGLALSRSSGRG
jgi:hypothetical protein